MAPDLLAKLKANEAFVHNDHAEPATPRSFFTSVSQLSRIPPPPKRMHRSQLPHEGLSAVLLEEARKHLVPQFEGIIEQASNTGAEQGIDMLLLGADESAVRLLDRLLPEEFWSKHSGMWELLLSKQVMAQTTSGQLPDVDAVVVVGVWGGKPSGVFRQVVAFVTAFTAMYPKRACTVVAMHSAQQLPDWFGSDLFQEGINTTVHHPDTCTHGTAAEEASGGAGLGWSPRPEECEPAAGGYSSNVRVVPVRVGLVPCELDHNSLFSLDQHELLKGMLSDYSRANGDPDKLDGAYSDWACDVVDHLQETVGYIPYKHARGGASCRALKKLVALEPNETHRPGRIKRVVFIDRTVDMLTPLLSQHTYSGLVEDLFTGDFGAARNVCANDCSGLSDSRQAVDGSMFHDSADPVWRRSHDLTVSEATKSIKMMRKEIVETPVEQKLNGEDFTMTDIRRIQDQNALVLDMKHLLDAHTRLVQFVKHQLSVTLPRAKVSRLVDQIYGEAPNLYAMMLCEQALYNPKVFPKYNLDSDPELILDFLTTSIQGQDPLARVMRLICVATQASSGATDAQVDVLRRSLDTAYGHSAVMTLESMIYLRLVRVQSRTSMNPKSRWATLCEHFQLCREVTSSSYGYPGYTPLSARVVHQANQCVYSLDSHSRKLNAPKMDLVPRSSLTLIAPNSARAVEIAARHRAVEQCQQCRTSFGVFTHKKMCGFCGKCLCSSCLSGEIVTVMQNTKPHGSSNRFVRQVNRSCLQCAAIEEESLLPPVGETLVVFIGGCTRGEVLALQQLARDAGDGSSYLAATTSHLSGHGLARSLQMS
eukprot:TRINITY_DN16791_c0_g1_i2.p1 TRINITY_DN16791_c0_g1~~TRINITY_DN16791_c0_g1_i2.p1  ORF type:complete len:819 (-),score=142.85 TRINITY_DN16791_c0_g1_i2:41-2497(-)